MENVENIKNADELKVLNTEDIKNKISYSLTLDSKILLNEIATNIKDSETVMDNYKDVLMSLENLALIESEDIVEFAINLYNGITKLYADYPDIEATYEKSMGVVVNEYNTIIKEIPDDRINEFVKATEDKSSDAILEKYLEIQQELQVKMKLKPECKFKMPKYYTVNVDYFDEQGTVYSQVIVFNRVINPAQDIEILGVLKYLIDEELVNCLDEHPLLTIEINKEAIAKIALIYKEFMMQIDKPIISVLQALNLGYQESFAIYKVKYTINLVFDETAIANTVEMAYTQLYCKLFEDNVDRTKTYSRENIKYEIRNIMPNVSWSRYGKYNRLIPYRKEQLAFNRAILIANSTFPHIISNEKIAPDEDILKSLYI